jgi:hypothetical protein
MSETNDKKPMTALEKLDQISQRLDQLQLATMGHDQAVQHLLNETMQQKQALAGIGKTLAGAVKVLTDKKVLTDAEVMREIRAIDDASEQDRVRALLANNLIELGEEAQSGSLVVISQNIIQDDGQTLTFSKFRTVEMANPMSDQTAVKNLLGKKAGESFDMNIKGGKMIVTVKAVYNAKQQGSVEGEAASAAPAADEAQALTQEEQTKAS